MAKCVDSDIAGSVINSGPGPGGDAAWWSGIDPPDWDGGIQSDVCRCSQPYLGTVGRATLMEQRLLEASRQQRRRGLGCPYSPSRSSSGCGSSLSVYGCLPRRPFFSSYAIVPRSSSYSGALQGL